jgi:hypothetical protein
LGSRSTKGKEEGWKKRVDEPDKETGSYNVKKRSYKVKNAWFKRRMIERMRGTGKISTSSIGIPPARELGGRASTVMVLCLQLMLMLCHVVGNSILGRGNVMVTVEKQKLADKYLSLPIVLERCE